MVFDIPDERGGATMDKRWANPKTCHFPLIPWIHALPMPFMVVIYAAMWMGKNILSILYLFTTPK